MLRVLAPTGLLQINNWEFRGEIKKIRKNTGPKSSNARHGLRQSCRLGHFQDSKSLQLEIYVSLVAALLMQVLRLEASLMFSQHSAWVN